MRMFPGLSTLERFSKKRPSQSYDNQGIQFCVKLRRRGYLHWRDTNPADKSTVSDN